MMRRALSGFLLAVLAIPVNAATRYIATTGSDSNPGTSSAPFLTFNKCFQVSALGDICIVNAGTYPTQNISGNGRSGTDSETPNSASAITFQPVSGPGTVTFAGGTWGSYTSGDAVRHLIIQDMAVSDFVDWKKGSDIHYIHMTIREVMQINCVQNWSIQNSDIGAAAMVDGIDIYAGVCNTATTGPVPDHGLIEGNSIHDITSNNAADHPDAIGGCAGGCGGGGFQNVTLRANKFWNNACHNLGGEDGDSFDVVENNFFGSGAGWAGNSACPFDGYNGFGTVIRYNTIAVPPYPLTSSGGSNQYWTGNIFTTSLSNFGGCPPNGIAEYNVWLTGGIVNCGGAPNSVVPSFANYFVNPSVGDYHLTASATLTFGKANPNNYPAADIDGQTRTSPPDAGADQRVTAAKVSPPNNLTLIVR